MKTKLLKVLTPLAISASAITPLCMTSCGGDTGGKTEDITVDKKEIQSGDSYTNYNFKLPTVPTDKKVKVVINNKTTKLEKVIFDPDYVTTTNSNATEATLDVDDQGNVVVPVCLDYAPTESSNVDFGLTFTYNDTVTKTVEDLKFDYSVDYDVELKDGTYDPETQSRVIPATEQHWAEGLSAGKTIGEIYMEDIEEQPIRFQSDARYSTSYNINHSESGELFNLKSFKAYFNDVYKDQYGLNVQMNYQISSDTDGVFKFIQLHSSGSQTRYVFSNFDLTCNFATANGYKFEWDIVKNCFTLTDEVGQYDLIGRMKGKYDAKVEYRASSSESWTTEYDETGKEYDGLIEWDESSNAGPTDKMVAFMFAFGLIHLTYDFDWATETPTLKIWSNYAKNIK